MTSPLTPIIPLAQMGHVEKIAEALQNQPGMQQALLQELAKEAIKEEQAQVPTTDPSQKGQKLKVDDERRQRQQEKNVKTSGTHNPAKHNRKNHPHALPTPGRAIY